MERSFDTDKRRYLRYELLDYAIVRLAAGNLESKAVIVDIGLGGLQLRTREHLEVGEICEIEVGRFEQPPLFLKGEIRHSSPVPGSELYASGIRFKPETHEERLAVAEYVNLVFQRQCDLLIS